MASLSLLPVTINLLSGEKHTLVILSECPLKDSPNFNPVFASQIVASLSSPPDAISLPSGEKHTLLIEYLNGNSPFLFPVSASHNMAN